MVKIKEKYKEDIFLTLELKTKKANEIIGIVDDYFTVKSKDLRRKAYIIIPRQMAMYYIRKYIKLSSVRTGMLFPSKNSISKFKDHSTVLHASKTIENLLECDKEIQKFNSDLYESVELVSKLTKEEIESYFMRKDILKKLEDLNKKELTFIENYIDTINIKI